jgi:cytochrome P450
MWVKPSTLRVDYCAGRDKCTLDSSFMRSPLAMKKGEEWRRVRNAFAPAFTTSRLKRFIPAMNASSRMLALVLERHAAEGIEVALKR